MEVPVDYHILAQTSRPIGLALRVGPYSGSFSRTNVAIFLADLAQRAIVESGAAGINISELQLDFDCAWAFGWTPRMSRSECWRWKS